MSLLARPANEISTIAGRLGEWERIAWRHPEWWSLGLSAIAWLLILVRIDARGVGFNVSHGHHHPGAAAYDGPPWLLETFRWLLMVLAMMLPLVVGSIRIAAARSVWERRHRAVLGFLLGYVGAWLIAGVLISWAVTGLRTYNWLKPAMVAGMGFAVAAGWQLTPTKRRALRSCHRTMPLVPHGWRADRDCLRYGWMIGGGCLISCWALMAACAFAGHTVWGMVCASSVGIAERYGVRRDQRVLSSVLAGFATIYAVTAFF